MFRVFRVFRVFRFRLVLRAPAVLDLNIRDLDTHTDAPSWSAGICTAVIASFFGFTR